MFKALPLLDRGAALAGRWQGPKALPIQSPFYPRRSFGRRFTVRMSAQKQSLQVSSTGGVTISTNLSWTIQTHAILMTSRNNLLASVDLFEFASCLAVLASSSAFFLCR